MTRICLFTAASLSWKGAPFFFPFSAVSSLAWGSRKISRSSGWSTGKGTAGFSHSSSENHAVITEKGQEQRMSDFLDNRQREQTSVFVDTLLDWNQKMNLTAVTERSAVMERHVEDSLALLPVIEKAYKKHSFKRESAKPKLVDVGSGAGLPGIILAIARPDWNVTLIESIQKRCVFLEHVIQGSGLSNVQVVPKRAEDVGKDPVYRENYDVAVARAVAEMRILAEYCLPLVRVGGLFVAAKGYNPQEEIQNAKKSIHLMGAKLLHICSVKSEGPYGQRTAVLCFKRRPTPKKYPRNPGIPTKEPL